MPGFSIRNPYFIVVICLVLLVIGATSLMRMPAAMREAISRPAVIMIRIGTRRFCATRHV